MTINTDKSLLDKELIFDFLHHRSYWAKGRSKEKIMGAIEHSFCFGAYIDGQQVGFARVVTDYPHFAWIMDVFTIEAYRGQGVGKALMEAITANELLDSVGRWGLNTLDAHDLYKKYGFRALKQPEMYMERFKK